MEKFVIGMRVNNHFGVLTRVSGMFARRGFNIDSLTVGVTEDPNYSRMTVTMTGDSYTRDQMIKQLGKIEDVMEIQELESDKSVQRELVLIKVAATAQNRQDVLDAANVFRTKVIDFAPDSITLEVTGDSSKLEAFIELMKNYKIIEICRTGIISLARGTEALKSKNEIKI